MFDRVIISGSAAAAFVQEKKQWKRRNSGASEPWHACSLQELNNLLSLSHDATELDAKNLDVAHIEAQLDLATDRHDALYFLLAGCDEGLSNANRIGSLELAEELLENRLVYRHVAGRVFSAAPPNLDWAGALELAKSRNFSSCSQIFGFITEQSGLIAVISQHWQQFGFAQELDDETMQCVWAELVENEYFPSLLNIASHGSAKQLSSLIFQHAKVSRPIPGILLTNFLNDFHQYLELNHRFQEGTGAKIEEGTESEPSEDDPVWEMVETLQKYLRDGAKPLGRKSYALDRVLSHINKTLEEIRVAILEMEYPQAKGLILELLRYQIQNSYKDNILKSLSQVLNFCRENNQVEMQEFSLIFLDVLGIEDPALLSIKAEILSEKGQHQAALEAFESVIAKHPKDVIAQCGYAEVLKAMGRLEEAEEAYAEIKRKHPNNVIAQNGHAEVLKAMGRLEEAENAYAEVKHKHPSDVIAQCGHAEVLKAMGRLEAAEKAYSEIKRKHPENVIAQCGHAEVLKAMGRLEEAKEAYAEIKRKHPENVIAQRGHAEVLKAMGRLEEAEKAYAEIKRKNPGDIFAQCGHAEVLKAMGRIEEADEAYAEIKRKHPENVIAQCGHAEVLKAMGRLEEAEEAYAVIKRKHPNNVITQNGHAEVLKAMGRLEEAEKAYLDVLRDHPGNEFAATGLFHIQLLNQKVSWADLQRILEGGPKTLGQWINFHIACTAALRQGLVDIAISKFLFSLDHCPFYSEATYIGNGLATAYIVEREFQKGIDALSKSAHSNHLQSAIYRLLNAHAAFELHNEAEGKKILDTLQRSEIPVINLTKQYLEERYLGSVSMARAKELDIEIRNAEIRILLIA